MGMVGYPNVGKSSTINVLCGEKKVNVSMTPGKTKHLQTIKLSDQIMLCDCPGLVFPSFLTTKADMICSGLLPIDHMRDPRPPTALVRNPFHAHTPPHTQPYTHSCSLKVLIGSHACRCASGYHAAFWRVPTVSCCPSQPKRRYACCA